MYSEVILLGAIVLSAVNRMRRPVEFQRTRRRGKKITGDYFIIHAAPGLFGLNATKVGITVGKDCGNSVVRHRLSRKIRGAMRHFVPQLPAGTGLVIRARPEAAHTQNLRSHLAHQLAPVLAP